MKEYRTNEELIDYLQSKSLIYGLFLYNKNNASISNIKFLLKLIISSILVLGLVNIFITSFWLHMLYGKAYLVIISTRAVSQLIMLPIQVTIIYILNKVLNPIFDKYLMQD